MPKCVECIWYRERFTVPSEQRPGWYTTYYSGCVHPKAEPDPVHGRPSFLAKTMRLRSERCGLLGSWYEPIPVPPTFGEVLSSGCCEIADAVCNTVQFAATLLFRGFKMVALGTFKVLASPVWLVRKARELRAPPSAQTLQGLQRSYRLPGKR